MVVVNKTKLTMAIIGIMVMSILLVTAIVNVISWSAGDNSAPVVKQSIINLAPFDPTLESADNVESRLASLSVAQNDTNHSSTRANAPSQVAERATSLSSIDNNQSLISMDESVDTDLAVTHKNTSPAIENSLRNENQNGVDRVTFDTQSQGAIRWNAPSKIAYSKTDITISGPNSQFIQRSYANGEEIVLNESLPDGVYVWESVVSPQVNSWVQEEMRDVRALGNLTAEQQLLSRLRADGSLPSEAQANENRQSGSFTIVDGIASPNYVDQANGSDQDT